MPATKGSTERWNITWLDFIITWQTSQDLDEVANRCAVLANGPVDKKTLSSRASRYRRATVPMKYFKERKD
jgi:hypothetical protein